MFTGLIEGTGTIDGIQPDSAGSRLVVATPLGAELAQGDSIAIRHMMYLSLSYDHRIVDGSLGATF